MPMNRRAFARCLGVPALAWAASSGGLSALVPASHAQASLAGAGLAQADIAARAGQPAADAIDAVLRQHARLAHATWHDCLVLARRLQKAVEDFLANPAEKRLQQARRAWLDARPWQAQAVALVDDVSDEDRRRRARINPWPMDEGVVDYVEGDDGSGLISDIDVPLTRERLLALHRHDADEHVVLGWHAIEFMLWGQDTRDDGPGERPHTDFIEGERAHAGRRRQYLSLVSRMLVDDLQAQERAWAPGVAGNAHARFVTGGARALQRLLGALVHASGNELGAGQVEAVLASQDPEDEQSTFADASHLDLAFGVLGVQNVWWGRYRPLAGPRLQGASPAALLHAADPALAMRLDGQMELSLALAQGIRPPFEQLVLADEGSTAHQQLKGLLESLQLQSRDLARVAGALGLKPAAGAHHPAA